MFEKLKPHFLILIIVTAALTFLYFFCFLLNASLTQENFLPSYMEMLSPWMMIALEIGLIILYCLKKQRLFSILFLILVCGFAYTSLTGIGTDLSAASAYFSYLKYQNGYLWLGLVYVSQALVAETGLAAVVLYILHLLLKKPILYKISWVLGLVTIGLTLLVFILTVVSVCFSASLWPSIIQCLANTSYLFMIWAYVFVLKGLEKAPLGE